MFAIVFLIAVIAAAGLAGNAGAACTLTNPDCCHFWDHHCPF